MSKSSGGGGAGVSESSGKTVRTADGVNYVKSDGAISSGSVAVEVDMAKLDKAWAKDEGFYLEPGKGNPNNPVKYSEAKKFISTAKEVDMPRVHFDKDGTLSVIDGRHRLSSLRELGKRRVWVTVERSSLQRTKKALS